MHILPIEINPYEVLAVAGNLVYLAGAAFRKRWCWFFGAAGSLFYVWVFFQTRLYMESGLNILYALMAVWGWVKWSPSDASLQSESVKKQGVKDLLLHIPILLFCSLFSGWFLFNYTNAGLPWLDAAISCLSVYATWLAINKFLENWIWWIALDALSGLVFINRGLFLTSILFLVYTLMAIWGYLEWKKNDVNSPVKTKISETT